MTDDFADVMDRVRATYETVAATTVLTVDDSPDPSRIVGLTRSPKPRRRRVLTIGIACLSLLIAGTVALFSADTPRPTTTVTATVASTTTVPIPATAPIVGADFTCGAELPKALNIPEGYRGPEPLATAEAGQLALAWISGTSRIEARWPADARLRQRAGSGSVRTGADGKPTLLGSSLSQDTQKVGATYFHTAVYVFAGVATGCESLQIDFGDSDAARADALTATMTNGGTKSPFVFPVVPLVVGSEEGPSVPTVPPCSGGGADVPPNRRGTVDGAAVFPAASDALKAFLGSNSTMIQLGYTEMHLPDGSIAYANKSPDQAGRVLATVHVVAKGSGWSVDRWEIVGC